MRITFRGREEKRKKISSLIMLEKKKVFVSIF